LRYKWGTGVGCRVGRCVAARQAGTILSTIVVTLAGERSLEERLAKLGGALIVLLEAIDDGTERAAAFKIREELAPDFGSDVP
jgi:hypothetical protein